MAIYELADLSPKIAESAWVADSAQVMGPGGACKRFQRLVWRGDSR